MACDHHCETCGGCAQELILTPGELEVLSQLEQTPFLPVARAADGEMPVYLEKSNYSVAEYGAILLALEQKQLIDLDYKLSLLGFSYEAYQGYPIHGSIALTAHGQSILDDLNRVGFSE